MTREQYHRNSSNSHKKYQNNKNKVPGVSGYYDHNGQWHWNSQYMSQSNKYSSQQQPHIEKVVNYVPVDKYGRPLKSNDKPFKKHHYFKDILILIIIACFGAIGYSAYSSYIAKKSSEPSSPTIEKPEKPNGSQSNTQSKNPNVDSLKKQMDSINLSQSDQKLALQKFEKANFQQQSQILNELNQYKAKIPSNFLKRQIAQKVINSLGQEGSNN